MLFEFQDYRYEKDWYCIGHYGNSDVCGLQAEGK
jgi:hypothetical protein